eukprot:COSAG06_NODE_52_length_28059_cov_48.831378_4_plen_163_part_00
MADIESRIKSECALQSVPAIDNIASKFGHRHQVSHGTHTHAEHCTESTSDVDREYAHACTKRQTRCARSHGTHTRASNRTLADEWNAMLCYAMLCYAMLCYALVWCGVVWCGVVWSDGGQVARSLRTTIGGMFSAKQLLPDHPPPDAEAAASTTTGGAAAGQ